MSFLSPLLRTGNLCNTYLKYRCNCRQCIPALLHRTQLVRSTEFVALFLCCVSVQSIIISSIRFARFASLCFGYLRSTSTSCVDTDNTEVLIPYLLYPYGGTLVTYLTHTTSIPAGSATEPDSPFLPLQRPLSNPHQHIHDLLLR